MNYPNDVNVTISVKQFTEKYRGKIEKNIRIETENHTIAGRIVRIRTISKKLSFIDLVNDGEKIQIMMSLNDYQQNYNEIMSAIKRNYLIEIEGIPYMSRTEELTIIAKKIRILSLCLHEIQDIDSKDKLNKEQMYEHPYLNYMLNPKARSTIIARTKIIKNLRNFLDARDFIEVQTPILNKIPSGANAKPFMTHHNDLNREMFLRIAPELYLKRLVIGGFDRVYEIGEQFRNERIDMNHLPSFTTCEFYIAYYDYYKMMQLMEEYLSQLVIGIHGKYDINIWGNEINFLPPYRKIDIMPYLEEKLKCKFPDDLTTQESNEFVLQLCREHNISIGTVTTTAKLLDNIIGEIIEPECINPTFLINHPIVMSPLAKPHRDNAKLTERFELFINKKEIANAYTELNDPEIQRKMFSNQIDAKRKGDDEAQEIDDEYCYALEIGLPPTAGCGIGIDRLVMMMTDNNNIKDVVTFPNN